MNKVKKIENFVLSEHTNNLYKKEAGSSIALARDVANKVNELVEAFNNLNTYELEKVHEQDGKIAKAILYMKDNLLNTINDLLNLKGDEMMDNAVKEYLGTLKLQLDNLLGSVKEGSTTLDAEVIDARLGEDNITYKDLGTAIRTQFSYTNLWRSVVENDCDKCTKVGHYFIGSGVEWKNVPGPIQAGVLVTYNGGGTTRTYQQFQNYWGDLYLRNLVNGKWSEWKSPGNNENSFTLKTTSAGLDSCNLNDVLEMGAYRLSSANTYENAPSVAGLLLVYATASPNQFYQMFISYDNNIYFRSYVNGYMYDWVQLAKAVEEIDTSVNESKNYIITKYDDTHINIYKKGVNGYIKYQFGKQVDSSINLNTYRLLTIDLCDTYKNVIENISNIGADVEGVVLLNGDSDHLGGVHGDEVATNYFMFVDGKQYTFENLPDLDCDEIKIIVNSKITHQDSTNVCMNRCKQITFDSTGVHINNKWVALEELDIESIRGCMFSIQKECFTHYYDSNVNTSPIQLSDVVSSELLHTDVNINDIFYIGRISAHHWAGYRGSNNHSTIIQDYGYRLKSYFNCYDNYKTKANEELKAENNFFITC